MRVAALILIASACVPFGPAASKTDRPSPSVQASSPALPPPTLAGGFGLGIPVVRGVEDFAAILRGDTGIVLLLRDAPEVTRTLSATERSALASVAQNYVRPVLPTEERHGVPPYPNYELRISLRDREVLVYWYNATVFIVQEVHRERREEYIPSVDFRDPERKLWQEFARLAPAPGYAPDDVRSLFQSTSLQGRWFGSSRTFSDDQRLRLIRAFVHWGTTSGGRMPTARGTAEVALSVEFTGRPTAVLEVRGDSFTYMGREYPVSDVLESLRQFDRAG